MLRLTLFAALLGTLTPTHATPSGSDLYARHCNACHPIDGSGGIGLPLTADKLDDVDNAYLFNTIRNGRPGRVMPAFKALSDAQVKALIRRLRKSTNTIAKTFEPTALNGDPEHGKTLFKRHCTACHGEKGDGEGQGASVTLSRERSFLVMPPAIANCGFQQSAGDRMIKHIISVGRPHSDMPAFGQKLGDGDLDNLVAYIRELGKTEAQRQAEQQRTTETSQLAYTVESPYDFETTVANLKTALSGANFRIFPERFLEQGVTDEFSVNRRQIGIRFCNFSELYGMLKTEPRLGVVPPCRITVLERPDGRILLVTPNLELVSSWFNNAELNDLWSDMEQTFTNIIDEATL